MSQTKEFYDIFAFAKTAVIPLGIISNIIHNKKPANNKLNKLIGVGDAMKDSQIKERWEEQEKFYSPDTRGGTLKDFNLTNLEISSVLRYINDGEKVLDIGCGDGYATYAIAKEKRLCRIIGIDYSNSMIALANKRISEDIRNILDFKYGDVLNLNFKEEFDKIITIRCLINLDSWEKQKKAINKIYDALKPDGTYIMLECSTQALNNLNALRASYNLPPIQAVWHNLFFDEEKLKEYALTLFKSVEIDNFCSSYMLI